MCEGDGINEVDNDDDDSTLFSLGSDSDAAGKHNLSLTHSLSLPLSLCCYPSVALNASMLLCAVSLFGCMRVRVSLCVCVFATTPCKA